MTIEESVGGWASELEALPHNVSFEDMANTLRCAFEDLAKLGAPHDEAKQLIYPAYFAHGPQPMQRVDGQESAGNPLSAKDLNFIRAMELFDSGPAPIPRTLSHTPSWKT